jgi:hypothetical protein
MELIEFTFILFFIFIIISWLSVFITGLLNKDYFKKDNDKENSKIQWPED